MEEKDIDIKILEESVKAPLQKAVATCNIGEFSKRSYNQQQGAPAAACEKFPKIYDQQQGAPAAACCKEIPAIHNDLLPITHPKADSAASSKPVNHKSGGTDRHVKEFAMNSDDEEEMIQLAMAASLEYGTHVFILTPKFIII
jgi:hypothetical protein